MIMEVEVQSLQDGLAGWGPSGGAHVVVPACKQSAGEFPPALKSFTFVLVKPSPDWMRPITTIEGNLLHFTVRQFYCY